MPSERMATDEEMTDYIASYGGLDGFFPRPDARTPFKASVTIEMDSAFEVAALIELTGESLETARADFSEAVRTQRSSDALWHAIQARHIKAVNGKLRSIMEDYNGGA